MTTRAELREAYEQLADSAPDRSALTVPSSAHGGLNRPRQLRGALVVAAVVVIAALPFVLVHRHAHPGRTPVGSTSPVPSTTSTTSSTVTSSSDSFWFTAASMPGFQLTRQTFSFVEGQTATYDGAATQAGREVDVTGIVSSPTTDARLMSTDVVRVGAHRGYYTKAHTTGRLPAQAQVAWKFTTGKWLVLSATRSGHSAPNGLLPDVSRAELLRLAAAFRPRPDANVALVKIGYLPTNFRLIGAYAYLHQGTMLSADDMVGTGYRSMSFSTGTAQSTQAPSLDITAVYDPAASLSSAGGLPALGHGPWIRTTLAGHLAWTDPHSVLIQWGNVQLGVSSSRITGSNTPLVGLPELLKVARSLTVPESALPGFGYPLATAVPPGHLK